MDVREAVQKRRNLRVFDPRPVGDDVVRELVEAMRLAPSCNNNQPWRVVMCRGEALARLKEGLTKGNVWATTAPMIIAIASKPSDDCRMNEGRDYYQFSTGLSVGFLTLMATELGLIAHPIGGYDPVKVREILGIPADYVVITLVVCGYPGTDESLLSDKQKLQQKERPLRKPASENFFMDSWGNPIS